MCKKLLKKGNLIKTDNKNHNTETQQANIRVSIDNKHSLINSVRTDTNAVFSQKDVYYIIRTSISNGEEQNITLFASLEGGVLQKKGEWYSPDFKKRNNPGHIIGQRVFSLSRKVSECSFGTEPVEVPSKSTITGDFVFRLFSNGSKHNLRLLQNTITLKKLYLSNIYKVI